LTLFAPVQNPIIWLRPKAAPRFSRLGGVFLSPGKMLAGERENAK
jgi:hypothetical protein